MFRRVIAALTALVVMAACMPPLAAASDNSLLGRVIILDAGHGAGNTNTYAGYDEQLAMFKLAQKIKPLLEARGATVHMTRPTQADVSLNVRAALINKWALEALKDSKKLSSVRLGRDNAELRELDRLIGITQSIIDNSRKNAPIYLNSPYSASRKIHPDWKKIFDLENDPEIYNRFLVISLHSNATPRPINTAANGVDVYVTVMPSYYGYTNYQRSCYFGERLLSGISSLGIKKNKVNQNNFLIIREHNLPGLLVENGFHTNKGDREKLLDDLFLDKLAKVYADTVTEYFEYIGSP
ncbi:MAG: N-acetylmuramoyl-L-alanine amidase [Oscillospiraceae bacterium]|nr:N-acetylmuramoyl-L-alanine amidase [Oscillospiraceae bacterium]